MRYHFTLSGMATIKQTDENKCGEIESLVQCWLENKMAQLFQETVWQVLKVKQEWSYDPVIPLLCIYSKEIKTYIYSKNLCMMFIVTLTIIAKMYEQMKYPWADNWLSQYGTY